MTRFDPFRAIHFDFTAEDMAAVTAPPYDVIDASERARLCLGSDHNVVLIDLPVDGDDPYATAAARLHQWLGDGVLMTDAQPSYTVYRMEVVDGDGRVRRTTGVIGALALSPPENGEILPHEFTTPKARTDRLDLLRSTRTNLSAVWGLSPAAGLTGLLEVADEPLCRFRAEGVDHTLWRITDPARMEAIGAAVGAHPIVIADGHHRYETSLTYLGERRDTDGDPGEAAAVMAFVVELVDDELQVGPIHRLLSGLAPDLDLLGGLAPFFEIEPVESVDELTVESLQSAGALALVRGDDAWLLRPRPEAMEGVPDLDSSRLDHALAALGPHTVHFQHGIVEVRAALASGDADAAVLLRPVSVEQIIAIADGGERMPPKSTFFHPKPRTGLVFRSVD